MMMAVFVGLICGQCLMMHPVGLLPFRGYGDRVIKRLSRGEMDMVLRIAGVDKGDWFYVRGIAWREDRWRFSRRHRNSRVGGLFGMAGEMSACPVEQVRRADRYARGRYGGWREALLWHRRKGWW